MAIAVSCRCGKSYKVKDEVAGRKFTCKACGQALHVPLRGSSHADLPVKPRGRSRNVPSEQPASQLRRSSGARKNRRETPPKDSNVSLIAAALGGGAVTLLGLMIGLFFVFSSGEQEDEPAVAQTGQERDALEVASDVAPSVDVKNTSKSASNYPEPRSSGAVSTPPSYLADSPFDIKSFFKTPPANQNAAPLYLDAFFEFSSDVSTSFTEAEQKRRKPLARQREDASPSFMLG